MCNPCPLTSLSGDYTLLVVLPLSNRYSHAGYRRDWGSPRARLPLDDENVRLGEGDGGCLWQVGLVQDGIPA